MKESEILKLIHLTLSKLKVTIFRSNTGLGWVGKVVHQDASQIILADPRPLHAGLTNGSSDLIGWQSVTVTAEMVGKKIAIFTAVEVKGPTGRLTNDQKNFIHQVREAGGVAFMARSDQEATDQMAMYRAVMGVQGNS